MGILADERTEAELARAMKFVMVAVDTGEARPQAGVLTDTSIAMLMVEMKRRGLRVSLTNGHGETP